MLLLPAALRVGRVLTLSVENTQRVEIWDPSAVRGDNPERPLGLHRGPWSSSPLHHLQWIAWRPAAMILLMQQRDRRKRRGVVVVGCFIAFESQRPRTCAAGAVEVSAFLGMVKHRNGPQTQRPGGRSPPQLPRASLLLIERSGGPCASCSDALRACGLIQPAVKLGSDSRTVDTSSAAPLPVGFESTNPSESREMVLRTGRSL